jgi:hypothetical protein
LDKDWLGYEGEEVRDVKNKLVSLFRSSLDMEKLDIQQSTLSQKSLIAR